MWKRETWDLIKKQNGREWIEYFFFTHKSITAILDLQPVSEKVLNVSDDDLYLCKLFLLNPM